MDTLLKPVHLGNSARYYVRAVLADGLTLCRLIAQQCDLMSGDVFSFLPSAVDPAAISNFAHGGVIPFEGANECLVRFLRLLGRKHAAALILFENRYAKIGDSCVARYASQIIRYGSELYHLASTNDAENTLVNALNESGTAIQTSTIVVDVGEASRDLFISEDSLKNIETLSLRCIAVATSAFDREGYVIWSKDCVVDDWQSAD